jgi:hypothetical protein
MNPSPSERERRLPVRARRVEICNVSGRRQGSVQVFESFVRFAMAVLAQLEVNNIHAKASP